MARKKYRNKEKEQVNVSRLMRKLDSIGKNTSKQKDEHVPVRGDQYVHREIRQTLSGTDLSALEGLRKEVEKLEQQKEILDSLEKLWV